MAFKLKTLLAIVMFTIIGLNVSSQQLILKDQTNPLKEIGDSEELAFKEFFPVLNLSDENDRFFRIKNGKLKAVINLDGQYKFGSGEVAPFAFKIKFDLIERVGSPLGNGKRTSHELVLDNMHPKGVFLKDLKGYEDFINFPNRGLTVAGFVIEIVDVIDLEPNGSASFDGAESDVSLFLNYEIEYGLKFRDNFTNEPYNLLDLEKPVFKTPQDSDEKLTNKIVKLEWKPRNDLLVDITPGYEVQVLRLYNESSDHIPGELVSDNEITTVVDWEKALKFYLEKPVRELYLTLGEGEGYYVWRVRAIGSYDDGGFGNYRNWGHWTYEESDQSITVNDNLVDDDAHFFKFTDPDKDKNYQFGRVFTEDSKVKEQVTYATGLNQIRQSQIYLPSQGKTVVTQSLQDYSGRSSWNSLPVPMEGKPEGYKDGFVKENVTGDNYGPEHFDKDVNGELINPGEVKNNVGTLGEYYSDGNPDLRIPSAKGFPFSRVIYANDGSNRVIEQSGVGREHMVGNGTGMGRTVKTFYGTPSEFELVALFGDEAPNPDYVQKVTTVDQNNTVSVSYVGLDGKTLATGLSFSDEFEDGLLDLDKDLEILNVEDKIRKNTSTPNAFTSSKKISLMMASAIELNYRIKCPVIEGLCAGGEVDCGYQVQFTIYNQSGGIGHEYAPIALNDLKEGDCVDGYKVIPLPPNNIEFPAGEYVIEKKLFKGEVKVEAFEDNLGNSIKPLAQIIKDKLKDITCLDQLMAFYHDLYVLRDVINGGVVPTNGEILFNCTGCSDPNGESPVALPAEFIALYEESPEKFLIEIKKLDASNEENPLQEMLLGELSEQKMPHVLSISSPCCQIDVDVFFKKPFLCPTPEQLTTLKQNNPDLNSLTVNKDIINSPGENDFIPDFEGYAIATIKGAFGITEEEATTRFYGHMEGWHKEGLFNKMVFHMLTDVYSCEGYGVNHLDVYDQGETPEGCNGANLSKVEGAQYSCADLAACWESMVTQYVVALKNGPYPDLELPGDDEYPSDHIDEQNEGDKDKFNSKFDDGLPKFFLLRWIVKHKLSKKMRKEKIGTTVKGKVPFDNVDVASGDDGTHFVARFLECTGYKFADILDPDADPTGGAEASKTMITGSPYQNEPYFISLDEDLKIGDPNRNYNTVKFFEPGGFGNDIAPNKEAWSNLDVTLGTEGTMKLKELFPYIKHPVYAFKYFEYEPGTFYDQEALTCFADPNLCWDGANWISCCPGETNCNFCGYGEINCDYLKGEWSCGQRAAFYQAIESRRPLTPEEKLEYSEVDLSIDCDWIKTKRKWYLNDIIEEDEDDEREAPGLKYLSYEMYTNQNNGVSPTTPPVSFVDLKEVSKEDISYVELEMARMSAECTTGCEERREEFKAEVIKMFQERCYVFGECKTHQDDNVLLWSDVDNIVNKIVAQCENQCKLRTYNCEVKPCRSVDAPRDLTVTGNTSTDLIINIGVGGTEGDGICHYEEGDPTELPIDCSSLNPDDLSWAEYTMYLQAKGWVLSIDVESKCNSEGVYSGVPGNGTHYFVKGELVPYNGFVNCDKDLPNWAREDYVKKPNHIPRYDNYVEPIPANIPGIIIRID